jgi:sugar/nucleoside kinase (ribokinase family)/nicotinamidase-related amidase
MTPPVVVLGDLVVDQTLEIERFPLNPGEHQRVASAHFSPGGAANTLIMGTRLGLTMQAVGVVGQDSAGGALLQALTAERVNTEAVVRVADGQTRTVYTLVSPGGQHIFLGHQGVPAPPALPPHWAQAVQGAAALFFDGWNYRAGHSQVCLQAAELAHLHGVPLFFDPGPEHAHFSPDWLAKVLACTHTLLVTEDELRGLLADNSSALEALARQALGRGVGRVVVKRGAHGSVLIAATGQAAHAGYAVDMRDTSGAGDALAAAMLYAHVHGYTPQDTLALANAVGAAAVMKLGAGLNMPTREEVAAVLRAAGAHALLTHRLRRALIVVDLQKGFITAHTAHLPASVAAFLGQVQCEPVVFTRFINQAHSPYERFLDWREMHQPPDTDLVEELQPFARIELVKHTYTALTSELRAQLAAADEVLLVGVDTDACVLKTAFDLFEAGYRVRVIADLCATTEGPAMHEKALAVLQRNIGRQCVLSSSQLLAELGGWQAR